MSSLFFVCFFAGLGLSVLSFLSGFHRGLHLVKKGKAGSMVNAAALAAFLTWFGGGGVLLERLTSFIFPIVVGGAIVIGAAGGALINSAINALAKRETPAQPLSMIGVIGKTVVPIRGAAGTGEIVFTHAGTRRVAGARSENGRAINKGTEVVVTRYEKGIAYVVTWDDLTEV